MALLVADTSALVSLGTVEAHAQTPLSILLDTHQICIPEQVVTELEETAAYDDLRETLRRPFLTVCRRSTYDP